MVEKFFGAFSGFIAGFFNHGGSSIVDFFGVFPKVSVFFLFVRHVFRFVFFGSYTRLKQGGLYKAKTKDEDYYFQFFFNNLTTLSLTKYFSNSLAISFC